MLQEGEKFSLSFLVAHVEDCFAYWDWWWKNRANNDRLSRPEIIEDEDPILAETLKSQWVDTATYSSLFGKFLSDAIHFHVLPGGLECIRADFRRNLVEHLASRSVEREQPLIVFAGGGYGAGKTSVLASTKDCPILDLPQGVQVGVDVFKRFLPEYEILSRLGEGRASSVVQKEARALSENLFGLLTALGRSFTWDSSLSNFSESMEKIEHARKQGYRLHLVGVSSPIEAAIARAMHRAKENRRFAHPAHLVDSHQKFASLFEQYFDAFDSVQLFWNLWTPGQAPQDPLLIAQKDSGKNILAVYGEEEFSQFLLLNQNQ
ncbi:MAG: zeta toxin family protein [Terrimicrobiaceae bacterium]